MTEHNLLHTHHHTSSRWNLAAPVNDDTLAYFLNIVRFVIGAFFTLLFIQIRNSAALRIASLVLFSALNVMFTYTLREGFSYVAPHIVEAHGGVAGSGTLVWCSWSVVRCAAV